MFALERSPVAVAPEVRDVFTSTWHQIAGPGTWWTGPERVAIAQLSRANRAGTVRRDPALPAAANDAIVVLAATPAVTTQAWVDTIVADIGVERYIELVGIVSRVVAVDTVTRLLGCDLEPLPPPAIGTPTRVPSPPSVKKRSTWVAMESPPVPPNVLAAVPEAQQTMIEVTETLYMTGPQMADPDITISGLHRTQVELVATTTSYANECFY